MMILDITSLGIANGGMKAEGMGEKIRKLRKRKGISLRELARRTGISPSFLSEIETAQNYPSPKVLSDIADELGVAADKLRRLDMRSEITELKALLEADPAWGLVFKELVAIGRRGNPGPERVLGKLKME